jgi:hypothetical protein
LTTYADSSALIPLYVNERSSESAEAVLRRAGQIPFTALHQLEVPNAFERLVGGDLMTQEECDSYSSCKLQDATLPSTSLAAWIGSCRRRPCDELHQVRLSRRSSAGGSEDIWP